MRPPRDGSMSIAVEGEKMRLDHTLLTAVSQRVGGAFYLFDDQRFQDNYQDLRDGLRREWPRVEVAYAMKANYMPAIGDLLDELDGWAEVVSRFEYEVARRSLPGDRVIFNGPIKREDDLRLAFASGSLVNIDSFAEIEALRRVAPSFDRLPVGLRLCFESPHLVSRFGFEVESGELDRALQECEVIDNLEVVALHYHATCRQRGVDDLADRVTQLCRVAEMLLPRHPIQTLDIGGGLLGDMPEALKEQFPFPVPAMADYVAAIGEAMRRCSPTPSMRLVVEPGVSMVANTMCLVARVMEVRARRQGWQALLDTSVNSVSPTRSGTRPVLEAVTASPRDGAKSSRYRLVGNTCMEHDVISESFPGPLEEGDFIVVANRGAYSLNYTPPFIVPSPAVVDRRGRVLKRADDHHSLLASYRQPSVCTSKEARDGYPVHECR